MRGIWMTTSLGLLMACAPGDDPAGPPAADVDCDGKGPSQILVTRGVTFARASPDFVTTGFDLDGFVSTTDDPRGCNVEDYTDPEGVEGIDNSMARLLPLLDQTEAAALEPIVQDSINSGALLLMFELTDLDDPMDDACVDMTVFKGAGEPMIGNDGWLLPNQTLDLDVDSEVNTVPQTSMAQGRLDAGPIDRLGLKLQVLDLDTVLELFDARVRLEPQADGTWTGLLAGGLEVQALVDTASLQNVDPAVLDLIAPVLAVIADLSPNDEGSCELLSVTMEIEAVPAFVYEEGA